jgi:transporter family-2 protein
MNVVVGAVGLGALIVVLAAGGELDAPTWPAEPLLYTGGVLGVSIVLSLAVATASLGVLRATLALLAAQLITGFAVDWAVTQQMPRVGVVAGSVLIVAAVVLVMRSRIPPTATEVA